MVLVNNKQTKEKVMKELKIASVAQSVKSSQELWSKVQDTQPTNVVAGLVHIRDSVNKLQELKIKVSVSNVAHMVQKLGFKHPKRQTIATNPYYWAYIELRKNEAPYTPKPPVSFNPVLKANPLPIHSASAPAMNYALSEQLLNKIPSIPNLRSTTIKCLPYVVNAIDELYKNHGAIKDITYTNIMLRMKSKYNYPITVSQLSQNLALRELIRVRILENAGKPVELEVDLNGHMTLNGEERAKNRMELYYKQKGSGYVSVASSKLAPKSEPLPLPEKVSYSGNNLTSQIEKIVELAKSLNLSNEEQANLIMKAVSNK